MSTAPRSAKKHPSPTPPGAVLTLAEAAAYLRLAEDAVVEAAQRQGLPGRKVRDQWRFLKSAIDDWLRSPPGQRERLMKMAGAWKDDPCLEEMVAQIYRQRGRAMVHAEARASQS